MGKRAVRSLADWRDYHGIYDEELAEKTKKVDPDGEGMSERTVRRVRLDRKASLRQAMLIHCATEGEVPLLAILDPEFVTRTFKAAGMEVPDLGL